MYYITEYAGMEHPFKHEVHGWIGSRMFGTIEAAKAAAQADYAARIIAGYAARIIADYAARIIAALDPSAVAKIREDALREALEICEYYGATGEAIAHEILALIDKLAPDPAIMSGDNT
jgi:hypothetical protein